MRLTNLIMLNSFEIRAKFTNLSYGLLYPYVFHYYYIILYP